MRRALLVSFALLWSAVVAAQSVYFGNLHPHTSYSDGSGTPAEAYAMARAEGLDFFAVTEHNHRHAEDGAKSRKDDKLIALQPQLYAPTSSSLVETANKLDKPGQFVTLYGQEIAERDERALIAPSSVRRYTIQQGDTLSSIAKAQMGSETDSEILAFHNRTVGLLFADQTLYAGASLEIPVYDKPTPTPTKTLTPPSEAEGAASKK